MSKQVLLKALRKAEKAGYCQHVAWLPLIPSPKIARTPAGEEFLMRAFWPRRFEIIYSHEFAKAIFGAKDMWPDTLCTCKTPVDFHIAGHDAHHTYCKRAKSRRGYKFHLKQMVVEEDPFVYLERFI